eukprot:m.148453 g.148453  ORF g.148453 m.148453 type:complete len:810 (+) comp30598_c0_seq1:275-2704(+)
MGTMQIFWCLILQFCLGIRGEFLFSDMSIRKYGFELRNELAQSKLVAEENARLIAVTEDAKIQDDWEVRSRPRKTRNNTLEVAAKQNQLFSEAWRSSRRIRKNKRPDGSVHAVPDFSTLEVDPEIGVNLALVVAPVQVDPPSESGKYVLRRGKRKKPHRDGAGSKRIKIRRKKKQRKGSLPSGKGISKSRAKSKNAHPKRTVLPGDARLLRSKQNRDATICVWTEEDLGMFRYRVSQIIGDLFDWVGAVRRVAQRNSKQRYEIVMKTNAPLAHAEVSRRAALVLHKLTLAAPAAWRVAIWESYRNRHVRNSVSKTTPPSQGVQIPQQLGIPGSQPEVNKILKLVSWNVNSLLKKSVHVGQWAWENRCDVMAVQELVKSMGPNVNDGGEERQIPLPGFTVHNATMDGSARHAAVYVRNHIPSTMVKAHKQFVAVSISVLDKPMLFVSVYVPSNHAVKRKKMLEVLAKTIKTWGDKGPVVVCGDWNMTPAKLDKNATIGKTPLMRLDVKEGDDAVTFSRSVIGPSGRIKRVTSHIDHFMVDACSETQLRDTVKVLDGGGVSDHNPIEIRYDTDVPLKKEPPRSMINLKLLAKGKTRKQLQHHSTWSTWTASMLDTQAAASREVQVQALDDLCEKLKTCEDEEERQQHVKHLDTCAADLKTSIAVVTTALDANKELKKKRSNVYGRKTVAAVKRGRLTARKMQRTFDGAEHARLTRALEKQKVEVVETHRRERKRTWLKWVAGISSSFASGDPRQAWKKIRKTAGGSTNKSVDALFDGVKLVTRSEDVLKVASDHFGKLCADVDGKSKDDGY